MQQTARRILPPLELALVHANSTPHKTETRTLSALITKETPLEVIDNHPIKLSLEVVKTEMPAELVNIEPYDTALDLRVTETIVTDSPLPVTKDKANDQDFQLWDEEFEVAWDEDDNDNETTLLPAVVIDHTEVVDTDYQEIDPSIPLQEFAMILGLSEEPNETLVVDPLAEMYRDLVAPELPKVCLDVSEKFMALDDEPAKIAREMLVNIIDGIDKVLELRLDGHEDAIIAEQKLEQLCIELFEYLGIEYSDDTVMQFIQGIMVTRKFITEKSLPDSPAIEHEPGTHEEKLNADLGLSILSLIARYPLSHILGILTVRLTSPQAI